METVENMKVEEPEGEVGSTNEEFKEIDVTERSETQTGTSDVKTDSNDITNTPDIDSEIEGILVLKCEPCLYRKLDAVATKYCKDCDERYCDPCTLCHTTQKQTKGHFILDIKECLDMKTKCEPCACKQRNTDAIFICKDCDEHLCKECKEFHVSQKETTNMLFARWTPNCFVPPVDQEVTILWLHHIALTLFTINRLKEQTQTGDSYSRDGSSCGILSASDIVADANSNATDHLLCEPCFYQNLDKPATHYCFTCDERYCEKCTKRHKTHRRTEDHNVIDLSLLNPKKCVTVVNTAVKTWKLDISV
ncbi:unnamed protein product [Mytilus edulis]|uniref:B box-type domain-containing protein n=1 Tax=Mytilus edulis TaxID=6550 RepID=A0A8S3UB51_MYTED|nr:unnamed protein product [Mytilus edulis]